MQLSQTFPLPAVDATPRYDDGRVPLAQVAHTAQNGTTYYVDVLPKKGNAAPPQAKPSYASVSDAVRAARLITKAEYKAAETGPWFHRRHSVVDAIAVFAAADGTATLRSTTSQLDGYDYRDGYIFKQWARTADETLARSLDPALAALVSFDGAVDFRGIAQGEVVSVRR